MRKTTAKQSNKMSRTNNNVEITVQNAENEPDTKATILVQNQIDFEPKVSVIIPVYNVEEYLRQCLDSVINQTLKEIEIICVDDGSTDSSLEILKEYAAKDHRITLITQQNLHAGVARNAGLAVAKGKYLSFLDSDDFFELNMLEETYKKVIKDNSDGCIFSAVMIDYATAKIKQMPWLLKEFNLIEINKIRDKIFLITSPNCWNKIFSKLLIDKYNLRFQNLTNANDVYFSFAFCILANKLSTINKEFIHYRYNTQCQITSNYNSHNPLNIYYALKKLKKTILQYRDENWLSESFYQRCIWCFKYQKQESPQNFEQYSKIYASLFSEQYIYLYAKNFEKLNTIPIVFATNDNYAKYVPVTITSILENSNKIYTYQFYIFHSGLSNEAKQIIYKNEAYKYYKNYNINFIDIRSFINTSEFYSRGRFSIEMWYRLLIPEILNNFEKVIYLDCDLIVLSDIAELYNIYIADNYIAAAKNIVTESFLRLKKLGIYPEKYFNSGVLIFNILLWNKLHLRSKCIEQLKIYPNLDCPDQDILNIVCANHVYYLDYKWNFAWQFLWTLNKLLKDDFLLYKKTEKDFNIIHYTTNIKPWNDPTKKYADIWWKYAAKTKLFEYNKALYNWYFKVKQQQINLDNPQTFNEKIQWLKLYDSTPIKTKLADKYLVRDWVKEKIGEKYLITLLGVYDKFEEIDFDKLPNQFVIKCNHGSGWNIIVKDKSKLNLAEIKEKLDKWLKTNFAFKYGYELHYRDIKPKIIIEKYVSNDGKNLYDYKFWCFNGNVKYMQFRNDFSEHLEMCFYDLHWKKQPFYYDHPLYKPDLPKPDNFSEMVNIAQKLCKGFAFVCVDLYRLNDGSIKFGEMTFTRSSGTGKWCDEKYNYKLGQLIKLPELAYNIDTGEYFKLPKNLDDINCFDINSAQLGKSTLSYKLFNFIPLFTLKQRNEKKVWKIFGLPIFKILKYGTSKAKYYILGIPILKIRQN